MKTVKMPDIRCSKNHCPPLPEESLLIGLRWGCTATLWYEMASAMEVNLGGFSELLAKSLKPWNGYFKVIVYYRAFSSKLNNQTHFLKDPQQTSHNPKH